MDDVGRFFSAEDLARIKQAVAGAERRTSGEIVPYAVGRCDDYPIAAWRGATLGAIAAAVIAAVAFELSGIWTTLVWLWIAFPALLGAALGHLAVLIPAVKRALIPSEEIDERVALRANQAFIEQEVFATRDRTGILIFLALFEHRVLVIGDSGINSCVDASEWKSVVDEIVAGIRAGRPGDALVTAIGHCGALLERCRVSRREDDTDELPDDLRLRGE